MERLERRPAEALRAAAGRRTGRRRVSRHRGCDAGGRAPSALSGWDAARRYLPSLLRASVVTIVLSCLSMALAVALGVVIATGRVYGGRPCARVARSATSS